MNVISEFIISSVSYYEFHMLFNTTYSKINLSCITWHTNLYKKCDTPLSLPSINRPSTHLNMKGLPID